MATDKHQCSTWHSPLNHGINCGRPNEQVVSQPFLFWFGFSSPRLDKFPFFFPLLSFFSSVFFYFFLFLFSSSIFFSFTISFFSLSSLSPLPPPLFSSHSIHLLTFPLVLPLLSSLPPFPPWVGENNAERIIFYGHNKCRFKPVK